MAAPEFIDAQSVADRLPFSALIEALAAAFADPPTVPPRLHGDLAHPDADEQRDLLVMPAWNAGGATGVKLVTLFEHNGERGRPRIQGLYVLFHPVHGTPLAILDAAALTTRRTAAASALAARSLARRDARTLLVCGTGRLARALPQAHGCVRTLRSVRVWGRREAAAQETVADLRRAMPGVDVDVAPDLEQAVRAADIVSTAIPARDAFLRDAWLAPGTHVDLVGSYRPDMHEIDGAALARARCFVDTRSGVLAEAGEFIDALADGTISKSDIEADLTGLSSGAHPGRQTEDEITLFKSVGTALEDLAAAQLAAAAVEL